MKPPPITTTWDPAGADDQVLGRVQFVRLLSGDGVEFQQRPQAFVLIRARGTADEVVPQPGDELVGGRPGELTLDVAVELREALVAADLGLAAAEQPLESWIEVVSGHSFASGNPAAATWARSRRRASWSIL